MSIRNSFDIHDNAILDILRKRYNVEVCDNPDYLFCGVLYDEFVDGLIHNYVFSKAKIRIMIEGENIVPDYNLVDYSISPYPIQYLDRNCYLPCGIESFTNKRFYFWELQDKNRDYSVDILNKKEYFASFIASHDSQFRVRGDFFKALSEKKRVESVGSYLNNMPNGETVNWLDGSKFRFQKKCKFSLCFESVKHEGFISEKIVEAFYADTIPVYWGSSNVKEIFNPKAFIDISDYPSFDSAIEKILEIDGNDEAYIKMLREPIFNDPTYPKNKMDEIEKFLYHIFDQPIEDSVRRSMYIAPKFFEKFIAKSTEREMGIKKMFPIKIKRTKKKVGRFLNKLTKKQ